MFSDAGACPGDRLRTAGGIQVIGINGGKAWTLFQKHCWKALPRDIPVVRLPPTSPAYTLKPEAKLALWHEALAPWLKKEKP